MESLVETRWDVTISGTGLVQSLLALALSRSGKKVLHLDKNSYYGGPEAAFSIQEAEEWVDALRKDPSREPFEDVSIHSPSGASDRGKKLSFSRAYTLSLAPQLIYTRSKIIPALVSSKVYRQLEFQAVGSWWIYDKSVAAAGKDTPGTLRRVPGSREDIFEDDAISMKSKRMLIRFLRSVSQSSLTDTGAEQTDVDRETSLSDLRLTEYLESKFNAPIEMYNPIHALSLCPHAPDQTPAKIALPRIRRHLSSLGIFGPGFGSVIAKWGGTAEIAQVGCRALAVGGGVYVLGRGIDSVNALTDEEGYLQLTLSDGEKIRSRYLAGSLWDLSSDAEIPEFATEKVARSISIVSSSLTPLFPLTTEGGPLPAGAVVVVPGEILSDDASAAFPVYFVIHSSDTGECPGGQCVVYGSVALPGPAGQQLLEKALDHLLGCFADANETEVPSVLWSLRFTQLGIFGATDGISKLHTSTKSEQILCFGPPSLDLAFDDGVVESVKDCWQAIVGEEARDGTFMTFADRETYEDD